MFNFTRSAADDWIKRSAKIDLPNHSSFGAPLAPPPVLNPKAEEEHTVSTPVKVEVQMQEEDTPAPEIVPAVPETPIVPISDSDSNEQAQPDNTVNIATPKSMTTQPVQEEQSDEPSRPKVVPITTIATNSRLEVERRKVWIVDGVFTRAVPHGVNDGSQEEKFVPPRPVEDEYDTNDVIIEIVNSNHIHPKFKTCRSAAFKFLVDSHIRGEDVNTLKVNGVSPAHSNESAIWDEGGYNNLVTALSPKGEPLTPEICLNTVDFVNGRHALLPVDVGSFLIFGQGFYTPQNEKYIVFWVYQITNIRSASPWEYTCNLYVKFSNEKYPLQDKFLASVTRTDEVYKRIKNTICSLYTKMFKYTVTPNCCSDYQSYILDYNDWRDWCADKELLATTFMEAKNITQAYAQVDKIFAKAMLCNNKHQVAQLLLALYKAPDQDVLMVYIFASIYDKRKKTTKGNRLGYTYFPLKTGDLFYYPNKNKFSPVAVTDLMKLCEKGDNTLFQYKRVTLSRTYDYFQ